MSLKNLPDTDMDETEEDATADAPHAHDNALPVRAFVRALRDDELGRMSAVLDAPLYALCSEKGDCLTISSNYHEVCAFGRHHGVHVFSVH
jgi:hypothetical protein